MTPSALLALALLGQSFDETLAPAAAAPPVRNWLGRGEELILWRLGEPMPAWVAREDAARRVAEAMLDQERAAADAVGEPYEPARPQAARLRRATLVTGAIRQDEPPPPQGIEVQQAAPSYQAPPQAPAPVKAMPVPQAPAKMIPMPVPQAWAPRVPESTPWPQAAPQTAYAAPGATFAAGWPVAPPMAAGASYAPAAASVGMPMSYAYPVHAPVVRAAPARRGLFGDGLFGGRRRAVGCGPGGCR